MIGPWEILLAFNRNPKDDGIHLGKNVACAIAQDIEKICADYGAQQAALAPAEKAVREEREKWEGPAREVINAIALVNIKRWKAGENVLTELNKARNALAALLTEEK